MISISSFSIVATLILLATVPVARGEQIRIGFVTGFAVDNSYHYETECTTDELDMIKISASNSIVKRGNEFFGTAEDDLHLDGDFVDIDENTLIGAPGSSSHRHLSRTWYKYDFVYAGMNTWTCKVCNDEALDARRRNLRKGFNRNGLMHALSRKLNNDLEKDYMAWLDEHGLEFGCLGNGKNFAAVFELI